MISIEYKTSGGTFWATKEEAMIADALESHPSIYLESYKLKAIVEAITSALVISEPNPQLDGQSE